MATDIPSEHVLVAFNNPPDIRVYRINADATLGAEVVQPPGIAPGIFPHQVLAMPDNRHVILVARGHDAAGGKPEDPGALKVFRYDNGVLRDEVSIAPNRGYGFGPRHLDFHPSKPWIYVSLERLNALALFTHDNGRVAPRRRRFRRPRCGSRIISAAINLSARCMCIRTDAVRLCRRTGQAARSRQGWAKKVFAGGENSIAVFAIDQASGKPVRIQQVDTHGIHCRTFHIDPSGRIMVCAHIMGLPLADGTEVPPRLTLFRIGDDGRLTFARSYDIETNGRFMWWMGMVTI